MKKRYICKCGKIVYKSTNADTTGNRDTAGCEGCPYLLPWGPDRYVQGQGFIKDIQGYECRVSPTLEYRTELHGQLDDKTTIRITSLDFDFLERVSDWVKEHYPNGELSGGFSRGRIRAVEYVDQGRYRYTLVCSQNKKGIAAKRALWAEFFDESFHRKDIDADAEKQKILRDIEQGKATHKDTTSTDKERNTVLIYRDPATGWLYRVSPQPENGSYVMQYCDPAHSATWKWCANWNVGNIYRESLEEVLEARAKREGWESISDLVSSEAMKTVDDSHGIMTDAGELLPNGSECRRYAVSRVRAGMGKVQAIHVCDDQPEGVKIWLNAYNPAEYWVLSKSGEIGGEHIEGCPYCAALLRIGCGDVVLVSINRELNSNKLPKILEQNNEPACSCAGCKREDCTCASGLDAAGRADCAGEQNCAQSGCTYAVKHRANPTPADTDASPCAPGASDVPPLPFQSAVADARKEGEDDTVNPTSSAAAAPASLAAEDAPAFDFSALGDLAEKAVEADKQFDLHYGRAQDEYLVACIYLARIHALTAKAGRYGGGTWTAWYQSKGISEGSARTMVQNGDSFKSATVAELKNLPAITKKDLNLIARQGAAEQVLEAAKESDSARIQEIVAQLKAEREAREQIEQQLADAQREHQAERESTSALLRDEQQRRQKAEEGRIAAEKETAAAQRRADVAEKERDGARQALRGTRKQEEKWREKAQTVQAQLDQLQAQPIPSTAIDMDELERRVAERMEAERAKHPPEDPERSQQDSRDAYDAFILATRSIDNIWKTLRPQVGRLGALQGNAKNMLLQQLMKVKEELIHECENRQSGS